jgi:hypothetical protein
LGHRFGGDTGHLQPPLAGTTSAQSSAERSWLRGAAPIAALVLLVSAIAHIRVPLLPSIGDELTMPAT